jgi:hypothetical protein
MQAGHRAGWGTGSLLAAGLLTVFVAASCSSGTGHSSGSAARQAGSAARYATPDSVAPVADPGVALATPTDGRLRGYGFSSAVTGIASGSRLGPSGLIAPSGQRLWVFGLKFGLQPTFARAGGPDPSVSC